MDAPTNQLVEYKTEIKYYYSTFNLNIKIEENNIFEIILIYENEIEYSYKYKFTDALQKHQQFKTINDFFKFLNNGKNYCFYILEINREFCSLALRMSDNIFNEDIFKLINKDKNNDIESYKEKKLLNYKVDDLIEICKKSSSLILNDISFEKRENCYSFELNKHNFIIFISKIKVIINTEDKLTITEDIKSNYDIYRLIEKNNLKEKEIFFKKYQLGQVINAIDTFIENGKLELRVIGKKVPDGNFGQNVFDENKDYSRDEYSEFFAEYFENFNPKNNSNIFKFEKNILRKEIFRYILQLKNLNECQKYKITGPFSTGKSMTLFIFSRLYQNVIYINLKVLNKNKDDYKKCLRIIFSECSRVVLNKGIFEGKIALLKVEDNVLKQLLYIIEIILESTKSNLILILDQFKSENIEYEPNFLKKLEELLQKKENFKIVFCSSINDKKVRDEVIKTWSEFNGNPPGLNSKTQEFYFYYYKLFVHKKSKSLAYRLFNKKYKYIKKAKEYKNLENIYNKIIDKLKYFQIHHSDRMISFNIFNLNDIFMFLKKNINIKLEKSPFLEVISITPLKYFCIDIQKDYYIIEPAFPFIIYCITKYINIKDCDEYFTQKKYLNISFLSSKVKGEYFEYSARKALQNSQIIKLPFNYNNIKEVTVNEIVKMNELESSFDDIIKEFNEKVECNENNKEEISDDNVEDDDDKEEEEIEVIEENEEDEDLEEIYIDKNNKIVIDLNKNYESEILGNKIEKTLSQFFLEDFSTIFNKDIQIEPYRKKYDYLIDEREKEYLKNIKDYRKEIYLKEITSRKDKIVERIKEEKEKRNKGKEKKNNILKIAITEKHNNKKSLPKLKSYSGNEIFYINQENPNGELLDYAVLYGKKTEKIFLGFKMKCYSSDTFIDNKFIEKDSIKKTLSPIILNSVKLFNCLIKEWHYFIIFYYNKNDNIILNVGYRTILSTFKNNVEYLLFDPSQKVFYGKDTKSKIKKLELSYLSNLDNITYINDCSHYLSLPKKFTEETNSDKFEENYGKGLNQFVNDFKQYSKEPKNIMKVLSEKLGIKNIFYCLSFHFPRIEIPILNQLILYKKKQSPHFIAILFNEEFSIVDLENEKKLKFTECQKLIDLDYEYTYMLRFEGHSRKRDSSDEFINPNLIQPLEKVKFYD